MNAQNHPKIQKSPVLAHNIHKDCPLDVEDNLYEYCALAQEICRFWADFVGSYGSEGVFFGRRQVFRLGAF